jgi:hypothetical protein
MTARPAIDYGPTPRETSVLRSDVHGVRPHEKRDATRAVVALVAATHQSIREGGASVDLAKLAAERALIPP